MNPSSDKFSIEVTPVVYEIMEIRINNIKMEGAQFIYRITLSGSNETIRRGSFRGLNTQLRLKHLPFGKYEIVIWNEMNQETICNFEKRPGNEEGGEMRIKVYYHAL